MKRKKTVQLNILNILIGVFCAAFLVLSILFMSYTRIQNQQGSRKYMGEVVEQSRTAISKQIDGDFETLSGLAELIGSMQAPIDFDALIPTLKEINNGNGFVRMGFVEPDGQATVVDISGSIYADVDLSDRGFVEKVYAGEKVLTDAQLSGRGENYVTFYGVPIYQDGKVIKVLYAANAADTLREITDASIFGGQGFAHIIDSDGDYVIRSLHSSADQEKLNIFDNYTFPPAEEARLRKDLMTGTSGFIEYSFDGEKRWAAYTPIGINGWSVIDIVPQEAISSDFTLMTNGMLMIVIGAICIFLFLVFMIRRSNARGRAALEKLAYTDEVTGYANFPKFLIDAERMLRVNEDKQYSIWYSDLKNFKNINTMFGYDIGDRLLQYWAEVVRSNLRDGETFGRASGDNFVILREFISEEESEQRFKWLVEQIARFPDLAEQGYKLEMCSGIYIVRDEDEKLSVNDMLDRANVAQKSVKYGAGSHCAFYTSEMQEKMLMETELETRMEKALKNHEFKLYFQPKIDIQHGDAVEGAEVLARWEDPERGLISPGEFIPLFEKNGFITKLDEYMFENACKIFRKRLDEGKRGIVLSVNASRLCMRQEDFVERYVAIKEKYRIPNYKIELEFTESIAFHNHVLFRSIVRELQENGFLCSMDDFGAGQSSLNILKDIPVDVLKLDMLFFREEKNEVRARAVVKGIVDIAQGIGVKTVAEGVESMGQVEFLRTTGCDMVQGYVFARPMPEEAFMDYMMEQEKKRLEYLKGTQKESGI